MNIKKLMLVILIIIQAMSSENTPRTIQPTSSFIVSTTGTSSLTTPTTITTDRLMDKIIDAFTNPGEYYTLSIIDRKVNTRHIEEIVKRLVDKNCVVKEITSYSLPSKYAVIILNALKYNQSVKRLELYDIDFKEDIDLEYFAEVKNELKLYLNLTEEEDNKIQNTTLKQLSEDDKRKSEGQFEFNQIVGGYLKVFTVLERLEMSILYEENLTQYIIDYLKDNRHSRQQNAKKINISSTTDIMKVYEQLPRFVIKSIVLSEKHSRDDIHKMMLLWIQAMKKKIFPGKYIYGKKEEIWKENIYSMKFGKKEEIAVGINQYMPNNQFKTGGEPDPQMKEEYSKRTLYGEFKRVSQEIVKEITRELFSEE